MPDFTKLRAALEADRRVQLEGLADGHGRFGDLHGGSLGRLAQVQAALQALDAVEQREQFDRFVEPDRLEEIVADA